MMEVLDTNEMTHPTKAIKGLEEIFWNFVWDMYIDDTDWGDPVGLIEGDEYYGSQGEAYSDESYWEDSRIEFEENVDVFHDMPQNYHEPFPSQEIDHNYEIVNIVDMCKFDRANYQISYDLSDRDHMHVSPPPGEGFSRSLTRVQLGDFQSLVSLSLNFLDSQVIFVAVVRDRLGGELRCGNSDELNWRSGSHSYLSARRGVG